MKNKDAVVLFRGLDRLSHLRGVNFAYAVSRNLTALKSIMTAMDKALEATPEYMEFDKARVELAKKHAEKNEKGESIIEGNGYVIRDMKAFEKDFEKLKKDNKELVEAREKQIKEYNELLELECVFTPYKIKMSKIPQEISGAEMFLIESIIEED